MASNTRRNHNQEEQRPPQAVQHQGIDPLGHAGRAGILKLGGTAQCPRAPSPLREEVDHGKRTPGMVLGGGGVGHGDDRTRAHLLPSGVEHAQKATQRPEGRWIAGVHQRYLDTELGRECGGVDGSVPPPEFIGHGQHDQGGQPQSKNGIGQHQMGPEASGVQNQNHRIGLPASLQGSHEHIAGHHLVKAAWGEAVNAGQVDHLYRPDRLVDDAGSALDSHTRIVGNALAQPGQGVEKGGLAGVGWPNQGNQRVRHIGCEPGGGDSHCGIRPRPSVQLASRTPAGSSSSRPAFLRPSSCAPRAARTLRTQRQEAVSLLRATRSPSTR